MPYKVFKEGGKFAVYKLDPAGKKTGKALGTHPDKTAAMEQVKAIYANEKKTKEGGEWEPEPIPVEIVEPEEEACGALSFAELMANYEAAELATIVENLAEQFHEIAENIMKSDLPDKPAALSALAAEFQQMMVTYAKHEQTEETAGEEIEDHLSVEEKALSIARQIVGDNQPKAHKTPNNEKELWTKEGKLYVGPNITQHYLDKAQETGKDFYELLHEKYPGAIVAFPEMLPQELQRKELLIWKEDGRYLWLAAYSNNRIDAEGEIISAASHKEFDEALTKKEWPMPEVYLWHIPFPVGKADFHAFDESAGFPIAAGHFYPGMEWAAEGMLKEGWDATSHGMPEQWIQYDPTNPGVIVRHRTKEISFLPQWAAANKLAFNIIHKELNMSELEKGLPAHKRPDFVKAFGEERVTQMEAALAAKSKEADDAGIAKKETPQPDVKAELAQVVLQIKEMLDAFDTRLQAVEKSVVKEDDQFDLVALLKSKSVIGKDSAKIDGRSALAKDAPIETEPVPAGGVHPVGLVNNLIAANQNYKGGLR